MYVHVVCQPQCPKEPIARGVECGDTCGGGCKCEIGLSCQLEEVSSVCCVMCGVCCVMCGVCLCVV